jgi:eukaryotic-like serine/threonine-protein kinase
VTQQLWDQLQATLSGSYVLERELGGGGMSRVFLAEEIRLRRKVVVKVLSPELAQGISVERFEREIQTAAALQQANIVPVLSAGDTNGLPYYTMPFVEGESLRARIAQGPLPLGEVVGVLRDLAKALAYAHDRGVVHRDIKPDNVLLSGGTAVVTDFGIAKAISVARAPVGDADSSLTQVGTSVGTPAYISPEQAAGDPNVDQRADLYSLGCVAYEMLCGQPPFQGAAPQRVLAAHLTEKPVPIAQRRADVPPALAALVMRALEKDPAARQQSAHDIEATLDATITPALLSGPGAAPRAIALYAVAFVAVALVAKAAVITSGIPDWGFIGAVVVMAAGLPIVVATALRISTFLTWRRTFLGGGAALGTFAVAIIVIMVLRAFGVGPAASLLAAGRMHDRERLIVSDVRAGGDSSLSHLVTEAIRTGLGQSSVVSLMPPTAIASALQRMERPALSRLDLTLARDIAQRAGIKAIVDGEVTKLGNGYVVSIRLVAADSGNELAAYRTTVDAPSQLLDAVDGVTRKLRGRIGESLKAVRDAPRLEEVTTPSLEALRSYAEGSRAADLEGDWAKAATLLREAVAQDTMFAMAYRKLGVVLSNSGMPFQQRDSALTQAFRFRDRLTERERYLAIGTYYQIGPGRDRVKAAAAFERVIAIDPTDFAAANNLANLLRSRRQLARAETLYRVAAANGRGTQTIFGNLVSTLFDQGKLAEAESVAKVMRAQFPAAPSSSALPPAFMYARGQLDSMDLYYKAHLNDPNLVIRVSAMGNAASLALLRGRLRDAMALAEQARTANAARGVPESPYSSPVQRASVEILFLDERAKAVQDLDEALARTPLKSRPAEQRPYFDVASIYALGGRTDKARALIAKFDAEVRDPTISTLLGPKRHAALAEIALTERKPLDAVREFWKSDSLPDGPVNDCAACLFADLGRAFDQANQPDSATSYWERYIAAVATGKQGRDAPVLAGIHQRLGELYEARGNTAKAADHYRAFIELWKNADPELQPRVAEARRRLLKLTPVERP